MTTGISNRFVVGRRGLGHQHKMGGVDHMPDDILGNILSRLTPKLMGQCRCVSTRWNRLISDPSFLMSRSPTIFVRYGSDSTHTPISIHSLDESNGSVTTNLLDFSMFKGIPTIKNWDDRFVTIVGTFSGIILFAVKDYIAFPCDVTGSLTEERMILYNPFTSVYEILRDPYSPLRADIHAYGFGYGATPDELKIVRFRNYDVSKTSCWDTCDVFNLKTRSWSQPEFIQDIQFTGDVGTFLKGYLYWMNSSKIMALNVDKMVFSEMHLPDSAINQDNHLGTRHGCLCMITNTAVKTLNFDVWVMNEQGVDNSWSKACSLAIGLERQEDWFLSTIKITEDGRIIIFITMDYRRHMIIYDTSKHSYKLLKCQEEEEDYDDIELGIKYKESLISPMNICRVSEAVPSGCKIKKSMEKKSKRRQNLKLHGKNFKIHNKIQKSKTKFKFRVGLWPLWYRLCHV